MREEWEKYLLGKAQLQGLRKRNKKRSLEPKGFGLLDGVVASGCSESTEPSSISKLENDALLAAASEISNLVKEVIDVGNDSQRQTRRRGSRKGRGKGRPNKVVAKVQVSGKKGKKPAENKIVNDANLEKGVQQGETDSLMKKQGETDAESLGDFQEVTPKSASDSKSVLRRHRQELATAELTDAKLLPPVQFYALDSDQHILEVWKPSVIIVYHPDMTFVREIEIYKAEKPSRNLKVYFLFYEDSTEVQKFEASICRENGAFETLIRQKSLMMIPVDQV